MCWVYLLECVDTSYYCGATTDLKRRIKQHNTGKGAKYTAGRRPVRLVWCQEYDSYAQALKEEWKIKRLNRKQKESLIKELK
jgi:putative endonuclease